MLYCVYYRMLLALHFLTITKETIFIYGILKLSVSVLKGDWQTVKIPSLFPLPFASELGWNQLQCSSLCLKWVPVGSHLKPCHPFSGSSPEIYRGTTHTAKESTYLCEPLRKISHGTRAVSTTWKHAHFKERDSNGCTFLEHQQMQYIFTIFSFHTFHFPCGFEDCLCTWGPFS